MNKDLLEAQWVETKEFLQEKWNRLTDEDIAQIDGSIDRLFNKLQQRYGFSREQAEEEIRRWNVPRQTATRPTPTPRTERTTRIDREEKSNPLKWLLWLGIPLLLLLSLLSTPTREPAPVTEPGAANNQQIVINAQTPADTLVAQNIRQALLASGVNVQDFQDFRISANNGVVTVDGSVATPEQRDRVADLLQRLPNVKSVNNNLQVRP